MKIEDLEYSLLYSMVVAGKSATFADNVMKKIFTGVEATPFEAVRTWAKEESLEELLRHFRSGNYRKLTRGWTEVANSGLDLRTCTPADLEKCHGIGPKTSRFFIIWVRPTEKFAALDTHVLKWLRYLGHGAPVSTPSGVKYAALEKIVLAEAEARGMTPRDLDSLIWGWCSTWPARAKADIWALELQRDYRKS